MSDTNTLPTLAFGRRTHPENLRAVWGARLIFPNDLVHDRQDLVATDDEAKTELIAWLNDVAIHATQVALGNSNWRYTNGVGSSRDSAEVVIYEDERGKVIGSPQASHGYFYVAGWLKGHVTD